MMSLLKMVGALFVFSLLPLVALADGITNGGFESGLSGWTVTDSGSGTFSAASGTTAPISGLPTAGPASGSFYAVSDQTGPGVHALTQSFTVAAGSTVTLSFDMFVNDWNGGPFCGPGLDTSSGAVECGRVDILSAGASAFDTGAGVLSNLFLGADANHGVANPYTHYSFDLTSLLGSGGTFQLRFAEADNQLFFNLGVDNVSIITPEPATLTLLTIGFGAALAGLARRREQMSQT